MPRRGMGVEMQLSSRYSGTLLNVMPRRGMGVEIARSIHLSYRRCVMPRRGMGVEIN